MPFPSVAIGMPYDNAVPMETVLSLFKTQQRCMELGIRLSICAWRCGVVTVARDMVLHGFLQGDADKLFWIDSDMVWEPDAFLRLVHASTLVDVVGATYKRKIQGGSWLLKADGFTAGEQNLFPVRGMGLGFTIVDRSVIKKLADQAPKALDGGVEMAAVFRVDIVDGKRRGEDMAFFADVRAAGYEVWLDASIRLGHMGECNYSGRLADVLTASRE